MADAEWVLHVDLDQFLAAVEVHRRTPSSRGKPVVVGGDGDPTRPRQVVATASYEDGRSACTPGCRCAPRCASAPMRCFLPSGFTRHTTEASEGVMATLRSFPAKVEVWGWDEAFKSASTDDPVELAHDIEAACVRRDALTSRGRHRPDAAAGEDGHGLRRGGWPRQPTRRRQPDLADLAPDDGLIAR